MAVRAGHKEELDEFEKRLEELRRRFDLYFHGSPEQRMPPSSQQAQLGGELRRMREDEVRQWNTVDKFRFNQIFARFVSMDRMWARTLKQIEDGIYKRDKLKVELARQRDKTKQKDATHAPNPGDDAVDVDLRTSDSELKLRRPSPTGAQPAAATKPGGAGEGMSEQRLKQLYDVYMQAKRRTGENSTLTMDGLRQQIEKQIPAIRAKHNCQGVDFKVVLKDGKAMLKAVPK